MSLGCERTIEINSTNGVHATLFRRWGRMQNLTCIVYVGRQASLPYGSSENQRKQVKNSFLLY